MTETDKNNAIPEPVPVDVKKLIDAIGTIFGGVIQILNATEPAIAKELTDMALNGVSKETAPESFDPNDFEEIISADDLPWDTEPAETKEQDTEPDPPKKKAAPKKKQEQTALTADDLIRIVTQKIKQNRANKEKVLALLKSYGAAKVSDIPADKYEAFLTDVSQL